MGFSEEKKQQIRLYLLEKIAQRQTSVVQKTAENFGVTPATVYKYLDRLTEDGTVRKIKRGEYELVSKTKAFRLDKTTRPFLSRTRSTPAPFVRCWRTFLRTCAASGTISAARCSTK